VVGATVVVVEGVVVLVVRVALKDTVRSRVTTCEGMTTATLPSRILVPLW
jgi:hypothetical protein